MSNIRRAEVLALLRAVRLEGVRNDSLRLLLIDRFPGIGGRFTRIVSFLESLGLVVLTENQIFGKRDPQTISEELLVSTVLASEVLATNFMFHCKSVILDSVNSKRVILNTSKVSKNFLWFILLLEQLDVFDSDHRPNLYLNPNWFDEFIAFLDLSSMRNTGKIVSPSQYTRSVQKKLENGHAAEKFVVEYEKTRLSSHPLVDKIKHVATENTAAGFDILSFNSTKDLSLNRMIEVKSWADRKNLFFSTNEYDVAADAGENYFLYLVDRKIMDNVNYRPEIIQNPAKVLFRCGDDWKVEPDGWKIEWL